MIVALTCNQIYMVRKSELRIIQNPPHSIHPSILSILPPTHSLTYFLFIPPIHPPSHQHSNPPIHAQPSILSIHPPIFPPISIHPHSNQPTSIHPPTIFPIPRNSQMFCYITVNHSSNKRSIHPSIHPSTNSLVNPYTNLLSHPSACIHHMQVHPSITHPLINYFH